MAQTPPSTACPGSSIDRNSPVPLYFQVAQHLENAINSGELPTGTLLQNEVDLAQSLGLSRPTMRRAMQHLVDKGLVDATPRASGRASCSRSCGDHSS